MDPDFEILIVSLSWFYYVIQYRATILLWIK